MNDLFKTKIGFIIGLLAVVFTVKPIIDDYSTFGFYIAEYNITTSLIYKVFTSLLCVSVYCISIQFVFPKARKVLLTAIDIFYAASLALPFLFALIWAAVFIVNKINIHYEIKKENIQATIDILGLAASMLSILLASMSFIKLNKTRLLSENKDYINNTIIQLERAHELFNSQMYDLAVLEAFKIIESTLRELTSIFGITEHKNIISLINECQRLELLDKSDIDLIHMIRKKRNVSAHLVDSIDKDSALQVLHLSSLLIKKLETTQDSTAYIWLMRNKRESLKSLEDNKSNKNKKIIQMLTKAWDYRDGAISGEISCFFEVALIYSPKLIIELFAKNSEHFEDWLNRIGILLFTDYNGDQEEHLQHTKKRITESLTYFISKSNNNTSKKTALKILDTIKDAEIRKII